MGRKLISSIRMRPPCLPPGRTERHKVLAGKKKEKKKPSHLAGALLFMTHSSSLSPSPSLPPQLLPERLLLWPRLLRQHGGGEHGGEGGEDEVSGDPVSLLHAALPLHELPGASG